MPFMKRQKLAVTPVGVVPNDTQVISDPFTGECQTVEIDAYQKLPDASLGDLKTLLKAKVDLQEVNTKVLGVGGSITLPAFEQAETEIVEKKVENEE